MFKRQVNLLKIIIAAVFFILLIPNLEAVAHHAITSSDEVIGLETASGIQNLVIENQDHPLGNHGIERTQEDLGVEPKKFTVTFEEQAFDNGCLSSITSLVFELWNVGELGGEEYGTVIYQEVLFTPYCSACREDFATMCDSISGPLFTTDMTEHFNFYDLRFTGGPNGVIYPYHGEDWDGISYRYKFTDGKKVTVRTCENIESDDMAFTYQCDEPVFDTSVFYGWVDPDYSVVEASEPEVEITREYIYTTYGINIWDSFGDDGYDRAVWSDQELTWLNDVLKELPPELLDRMAVNRIVRNSVDIDEDGNREPSTYGVYEPCDLSVDPDCDGSSATIRVFDHAKTPMDFLNDPDGEMQFKATILHEMVHGMQAYKDRHSIYVNDYSPLQENWIDATKKITDMEDPGFDGWNGWNWDGRRWRYTNDSSNQPPTRYGLTDPDEDMAESVMMYVYDPERLKNSSYERYYFIRDEVFGGVEYEDGVQKKP